MTKYSYVYMILCFRCWRHDAIGADHRALCFRLPSGFHATRDGSARVSMGSPAVP